ncbi:TetR/AcrR family transcriptional regulator [Pseudonocardia sp. KRD291]|uniref:TetR/AcrR family transcriptional regulator n=1 Tax=Pseudonocardia sp. KRD291 TaxID=2792007 RepID=UPI001C49FB6F|nr:TetR/AcrR family transcriptional regulator [Pseudonocardia sp. KRD291]MBW0100990.1 TetR family transcriptional regulator [Pseudonocardia sp. KRD291]
MTSVDHEQLDVEIVDWRRYTHDRTLPDVLDAALDVFVKFGYHGTTVRAIAMKAGLSVPGLYHHHSSKQEMLATLLRISNEDVMARSRAALAAAEDAPRDRFIALVENIVLYMSHRRRLARAAREIHALEEPYRSRHVALRDELQRMVLTEVEAARATGEFRTTDPNEATRAVLVLCQGVAEWYTPGGPKRPEEIAAQYIGFALALVGGSMADPT